MLLLLVGGTALSASTAHAAFSGTLNGLTEDAEAYSDGTVGNVSATQGYVGGVAGVQRCVVNMFRIPAAILNDPTQQFSTATYRVRTGYMTPRSINGDLYGIGFSSTSAAVSPSDYYGGAYDNNNVLINDNFILPTTPSYTSVSTSNSELVDYLNAQLDALRQAGATDGYVFFRINPDAYIYWNFYPIDMAESGGGGVPTLDYTTITVPVSAPTGMLWGLTEDAEAYSDGTVGNITATQGKIGGISGVQRSVVNMFQIPASILNDSTKQFTEATYSVRTGYMVPRSINGDLYGIGFSTTSAAVNPSDYFGGAYDSNNVLIHDNFILPSTPSYTSVSTSNPELVGYLNDQVDAMRQSGATDGYVFFRINPDAYIYWNFYPIDMADGGGGGVPTLSYTLGATDFSNWTTVPLGGGGYVTGIVSDASTDTIYCRTDVGGAFRWAPVGDADGNGSWVSISDTLVPFGTLGSTALMCVESIAVDPSTPNRIYMAVGNPQIPSSPRGIYVSDNAGGDWSFVDTSDTFVIQGNHGSSRAKGERLAVDPNDPNTFWYGSTKSGLKKFVKSGGVWTSTQISSSSVPYGSTNTGVTFVVCDPNGGNTITYAGVYDETNGGVYKSSNGGTTWSKVGGDVLTEPRRAQISSNGTLYVTGGTDGAAKLVRHGTLSFMSALPTTTSNPTRAVNYHAVAVDPNDASGNTVYVAEANNKDRNSIILRSDDGGVTWANQISISQDREEPDGSKSLTGYWFGSTASLMVNPANSDELWLSDFFGVIRTNNAQDIGTSPGAIWKTLQKGQEETVVLDLKSPPSGGNLLTGLADVGGYLYHDTTSRPIGAAGSKFTNDNVTGLDFSEGAPDVWVRATAKNPYSGTGAVSLNGGVNWITFGQLDAKGVTNSATAGWESFDIGPYLKEKQDEGATSVTLVVRANTWSSSNSFLHFSSKEGSHPPELVLNGANTLTPTADALVLKSSSGSNTNYGDNAELQAQDFYGQSGRVRWSYLKFDLSGQPTISSATLRLYRLASSSDTSTFSTTIHSTPTTSWVEGNGGTDNSPANEIKWSNKPTDLYTTPGAFWKGGGRVAVSATNPDNIVWMGIKNGSNNTPMYYSTDRGVTWAAASGGPNSNITGIFTNGSSVAPSGQPLVADRSNGYFYAATFGGSSHQIYRSTNGGKNWSQVSTVANGGSHNMRTPQLVAAPASPTYPTGGDVWLCDDGTYHIPHKGGGLWRSTDSGTSWSSIPGVGKVSQVSFGQAASGTGYTVFINGEKDGVKGVYRSDDYGATWEQLADPTIKDITALAGDRQNYGKVYIGTAGRGVFQSQ
ncbi:hypothetical protein QEH52_17100 [Coraliomargarita sp. SDUM461003]|uniref:Carbohydrate-binding module family 96 domain-containing protein n=1 Tax=Thalassobacterium maritimum TaxID=3041265 RepID=A0ABU1AYN2_9BACT|nr:hypothetical protein [Coraliomargarita sp. SDUM461003]MDQ8209247.1 hypothetical protein [Coraliomargarita sp. SDUM461003]